MGLIDGADKNLDGALAPSSPMLEPPLIFPNICSHKYCIRTLVLLVNQYQLFEAKEVSSFQNQNVIPNPKLL